MEKQEVRMTIRIKKEIYDEIKEAADDYGMSINSFINMIGKQYTISLRKLERGELC